MTNTLAPLKLSNASALQLQKAIKSILSVHSTPNGVVIRTSSTKLRLVAAVLANSTAFRATTLLDIAVVDKLGSRGRFVINYLFLSTTYSSRLTVQVFADETSSIPSVSTPFFCAKRIFASAG